MLIFDSEMVKEVYGSMAQSSGMTTDELIKMVKDVFSPLDMTYNIVLFVYLHNCAASSEGKCFSAVC